MPYTIKSSDRKVLVKDPLHLNQIIDTNSQVDYLQLKSYHGWAYGAELFSRGDKFTTVANSVLPGDELIFEFWGGSVDGMNISANYGTNYISEAGGLQCGPLTGPDNSIVFADFGFGMAAQNYTDVINNTFSLFNLKSMIYATDGVSYGQSRWVIDYIRTDNFCFIFKETGRVDGGALPVTYYMIKSVDGVAIEDKFSQNSLYYFNTPYGYFWNSL